MEPSLVRRAGRPVRAPGGVYQQLQALNLGEVWQNVDRPVLVIRGSKDAVMSRADSAEIAETVNPAHPGKARYVEVDGMTHGFAVEQKFQAAVVTIILNWAKRATSHRQMNHTTLNGGRLAPCEPGPRQLPRIGE